MKKVYFFILISAILGNFYVPNFNKTKAAVATWDKGATIYPRWSTDFGSDTFKQSLTNLAGTGANAVSLIIPLYQTNLYTTDIQVGANTPTDASLAAAITEAHGLGMKVLLKPHLDSYTGEWRAYINPSDRTTWFNNYGAMLKHYAQIAQTNGAEEFSVGVELINMSTFTSNGGNTQNWINLISQIRNIYGGQLTYSANWGPSGFADEKDNINFWGNLDFIGISAYFNLNTSSNDVPSLESEWANWNNSQITPLQQKYNKPITFTEGGYKSVTGAHTQPWNYSFSGPSDQTEQANDFQALFDFWNNYGFLKGVYIWEWSSDPNAGGANNTDYTPQNKQAQTVITNWYSSNNPPPQISCAAPAINSFTGCYYKDQNFGTLALSRTDSSVNFDWGGGSPDPAIPADHFSAEWQGNFNFNAGDYTFTTTADDGVRVFIDGNLIIDKFINQPATTYTSVQTLASGAHLIKMDYFENTGNAVAKLSWSQNSATTPPPVNNPPTAVCPRASVNAFTGCYYNGKSFENFILNRVDNTINFDWGGGSPDPGIGNDNFSAKWEGLIDFAAGDYTFSVTCDDGCRLFIDNSPVIDQWQDQPATTYTIVKTLSAARHTIRMEYYENGGNAVAKLSWAQNASNNPPAANNPPPSNNPPTTSSQLTYVNGYPTMNGNYIDCSGNIDNDPGHHTTNPGDTDPAHHVGQNCPAGSFVYNNSPH